MKISIVTPSYNQGAFLERTIQSVIGQGFPDLEYIIIDGGSTDTSLEIIKKYANKLSYYISEPDTGQSDALNKGFEKAKGDIFAWLNSDDQYYPGILNEIAEIFEKNPSIDLIYGYHNDVNERDEIIRKGIYIPFFPHAFKTGFGITQPTSFWRRSVWEKCGPLDTNLHYCMDYDFYAKALRHGFKFKCIPLLVCKFRYHKTNKGTIAKPGFTKETKYLLVHHFPKFQSTKVRRILSKSEYLFFMGIRRVIRSFK